MMLAPEDIAELAVETRVAADTAAIADLSYALLLEAHHECTARTRLELLAAQIGLSSDATKRVLDDAALRAELIGKAHRLLKALIPHAATVGRLIGELE